jgi:hypothetical protein
MIPRPAASAAPVHLQGDALQLGGGPCADKVCDARHRDVLVMLAARRLGRWREDRLGQLRAVGEPGRKGIPQIVPSRL